MNIRLYLIAFVIVFTMTRYGIYCASNKKVVGYYGSWAVYRPGKGKYDINNIDPTLFTHLIYAFVGLDGNNIKILDPFRDLPDGGGKNGFAQFNALRNKNPSLKTLVAIGGWNEGSTKYSKMASTPASRAAFAQNAVAFVKKYNFNGFDIDWEYPAQRGGAQTDVNNFIELLKVLRSQFDKEGLILSAAVAAAKSSAAQSYRIRDISNNLDFINLMAYDFHVPSEPITGMNAPLFSAPNDPNSAKGMNVEASVNYWLSQGAAKEKLILGVPAYGRTFVLANPQTNGVGAPARGAGKAGPYTAEPGLLGYNEFVEQQNTWKITFDTVRRVPYASQNDQWLSFDNVQSIREKGNFINKLGLGGAMIWSIETDDFLGASGQANPLIRTLKVTLDV